MRGYWHDLSLERDALVVAHRAGIGAGLHLVAAATEANVPALCQSAAGEGSHRPGPWLAPARPTSAAAAGNRRPHSRRRPARCRRYPGKLARHGYSRHGHLRLDAGGRCCAVAHRRGAGSGKDLHRAAADRRRNRHCRFCLGGAAGAGANPRSRVADHGDQQLRSAARNGGGVRCADCARHHLPRGDL
ncbi:hypothetical protein D9M68_714110 [compost metagenome]